MLRNPSVRYRLRRPRVAGFVLALSALAAAFFLWPISRSVRGPVVFVPAEARPVYATGAGELQFALTAGTVVQAGDVLARLVDTDSQLALARQQGEFEVRQVRYQQLGALRAWDEHSAELIPTADADVKDAAAVLAQLENKAQELTVVAPTAGVIVAPPLVVKDDHDESRLSSWAGSPLEPRNLGCWVEPGTVLCLVANPDHMEALVMIDQADVADVQPGQQVRILLESSPAQVVTGEVTQVARRSAERATVDSAVDAGKYHLIQVRLDAQDVTLLVGSRGTAKIESRRSSLGKIVADELLQMFRLPW